MVGLLSPFIWVSFKFTMSGWIKSTSFKTDSCLLNHPLGLVCSTLKDTVVFLFLPFLLLLFLPPLPPSSLPGELLEEVVELPAGLHVLLNIAPCLHHALGTPFTMIHPWLFNTLSQCTVYSVHWTHHLHHSLCLLEHLAFSPGGSILASPVHVISAKTSFMQCSVV